jgi:hypothetical protein
MFSKNGASLLQITDKGNLLVNGANILQVLQALQAEIDYLRPVTGSIIFHRIQILLNCWLICDGSALSRSTYSALFTVVSTWAGNGSTYSIYQIYAEDHPRTRSRPCIDENAWKVGIETHGLTTVDCGNPKAHSYRQRPFSCVHSRSVLFDESEWIDRLSDICSERDHR